ncbi:MAG: glycosyltransferase family 2 protein [Thermodesulfobacteriota bacterium]
MSDEVKLTSIIVSTYNEPQALAVVLDSLALQTRKQFEVIIADDGSKVETGEMIAEVAAGYPVRLHHVWQEDHGFRAAAARNRAVAESRGDYLLFLDGDCVVFQDFVETHINLAEAGWFVAGNRILLDKKLTDAIISGQEDVYEWPLLKFLKARLLGEINRLLPLFRLPAGFFRKLRRSRWQGAMTCNLAVWREDFYRVNGFDEGFIGWGHEDAEFVSRLINSGIFRKEGRFGAPVLHMWHRVQDRINEKENLQKLFSHIEQHLTRAEKGIDSY